MTMIVKEAYAGKAGPEQSEGATNQYVRRWIVVSTTNVTGQQVLSKIGIKLGSIHPDYPGCACVRVRPEQDPDNENVWRVEAMYASRLGNWQAGMQEPETMPLLRPAEIVLASERAVLTLPHDLDDKPYKNEPFGEVFDGPPIHYGHLRIVVTKNQAQIAIPTLKAHVPSVNSDGFNVGGPGLGILGQVAKGEALMDSISGRFLSEHGVWFWRVTYQILINPRKWIPFLALNMAHKYIREPGDPDYEPGLKAKLVVDDCETSYMGVVPITKQGFKANGTTQPYHWLEFRQFEWKNFGALGIFS